MRRNMKSKIYSYLKQPKKKMTKEFDVFLKIFPSTKTEWGNECFLFYPV